MNEKTEERIGEIGKKITLLEQSGKYLEKRIADISRNINIVLSALTVIFSVVFIIGFFSFQSEKAEITIEAYPVGSGGTNC